MKWTVSSLYLLIFVTLLGFGFVLDRVYSSYFTDDADETGVYRTIFESVRHGVDAAQLAQLTATESDGRLLPDLFTLEKSVDFPLPVELAEQLNQGSIIILDSESGLSLHQKLSDPDWILSFGPIAVTRADARGVEYGLTTVFYLGVALVLVLWVRPLIRDVQLLSQATAKLGKGEFEARLSEKTWFLKKLFSDYNKMAARLQALNANNQLFSQAVSHDLRTPLARIEFALEKLRQDPVSDNQASAISKIRHDISLIDALTSELMDYARIGQTRRPNLEQVDLHVYMHQVIAEYDPSRITIAYQRESDAVLPWLLDVSMFHKLMSNLIDNAIRYADNKVLIKLTEADSGIEITIEDDGKGFDADNLGRIFEPFTRQGDSGNHFGLGLAICDRVVQQHKGSIHADNLSSLGGARLSVRLPR